MNVIGKHLRTDTRGLRNWDEVLERLATEMAAFKGSPGYRALLDLIDVNISHLSRSIASAAPLSDDVHQLQMMIRFWSDLRDTLDEWTMPEGKDPEDVQDDLDELYATREEAMAPPSDDRPQPMALEELWDFGGILPSNP